MKKLLISLLLLLLSCVIFAQSAATEDVSKSNELKDWKVTFGAFTHLRYYKNESHSPYGTWERLALNINVITPDKHKIVGSYWYQPDAPTNHSRNYIETLYYEIPTAKSSLKIGKTRNANFGLAASYPNRRTTQYGIVSETFTQDRSYAIQYNTKLPDNFSLGTSVYLTPHIGARGIGATSLAEKSTVVPHFAERDNPDHISGKTSASIRLAKKFDNLNVGLSAAAGNFGTDDLAYMNNVYGDTDLSNDHVYKYGLDMTYSKGKLGAVLEAYYGQYSDLDIFGTALTADYVINKYGTKVMAKYGYIDNNKPSISGKPITYEPSQLILGVSHPICKNAVLEFNYEFNNERGGKIDNDLGVLELTLSM